MVSFFKHVINLCTLHSFKMSIIYKLRCPQSYFPQVRRQTSSKLSSHALVGNGAIVNVFTHLTVCSFRFSSAAAHCGRYLSDIGPQTVPCQVQKAKKCRYPYRHLQQWVNMMSGAAHCGRYLIDIGLQTVPCQVQKEKRCR